MRRYLPGIVLLSFAPLLSAGVVTFNVFLNGAQETPPVASAGTGTATVTIDDIAQTIFVSLAYSGLTSPATNAHIHCCNGPGVTSPVIIPFIDASVSPSFVTGSTSGTFSHLFTTANPGVTAANITALEDFKGYVNIHTSNNPGGEIRANLVPEPGTMTMMGLALAGLVGWQWKRRRRR